MSFTAFHTGTLSESSPKGADELSEIGGDAFENKDVKGYRSIRSWNGMHGLFSWLWSDS